MKKQEIRISEEGVWDCVKLQITVILRNIAHINPTLKGPLLVESDFFFFSTIKPIKCRVLSESPLKLKKILEKKIEPNLKLNKML